MGLFKLTRSLLKNVPVDISMKTRTQGIREETPSEVCFRLLSPFQRNAS
jgi:hypothetical protein